MSKPVILTVDDDPAVSAAIARDLRRRYSSDYSVVRAASGSEALEVVAGLALRDQPVAVIAADRRMPQMTGIEMLKQARTHAPTAKFLLLTAYADTDVAIEAINDIGLDHYLLKPWDPPEERLYPVTDDLLGDWSLAHLVVATGVSYRRLDVEGIDALAGRGVYDGVNAGEAGKSSGDDVYIVGAANSAGQAALHLASFAKRVVLVVRAATLDATMSRYLIARIAAAPNIDVRCHTEVTAAAGDGHLERLTLTDTDAGTTEDVPTSWLFIFIGAYPRTDWLGPDVARDDKGFVLTGPELLAGSNSVHWSLPRAPFALETSVPGVFAAGDVRLDSMKRIASAVGEGAMSIYLVHRYLATI
jgi:thioredoxin reductase (NADPH)